jgi:long-subunit acyl-CoA synthetase (AMP-forming)
MTEYYKEPELTKAAFTDDGFFRTGDKGEWDESCQAFRITGRVKDLFKSAKGKYVTPVPIESKLSASPLLEQICVMGSGLPAPIAVVVLSAIGAGMPADKVRASLEDTLTEVNSTLESHERLAAIVIAKDPWTIENELLTPTMKLKRDQLEEKYKNVISQPFEHRITWE